MVSEKVKIRNIVLQMTDNCNLRCKYCFIEDGIEESYTRKTMNEQTCKKALSKFFQLIEDEKFHEKPSVIFYGGEPLLNWETIKIALPYIDHLSDISKIEVDKVIITNGTLINDDIASTLSKYKVETCLSLDGNKELNDKNRLYKNNEGSFEQIVKAISILRKYDIEPALSCVMSKDSIYEIENIAKFFFEEIKIKALGFNHVSIIPNNDQYSKYDEEYERNYASSLIKMQSLIQNEYQDVYEKRMGIKIKSFLDKELIVSTCTGTGEQISVSTDGQIGICQGYMGSRKTFNNSVYNDEYNPKKDKVFLEWSKRSPLKIKECRQCIALANCGGGCPRNAETLTGSIWNIDKAFCHFSKKAIKWILWESVKDGYK